MLFTKEVHRTECTGPDLMLSLCGVHNVDRQPCRTVLDLHTPHLMRRIGVTVFEICI